jgi:hypothetical protein
MGRRLIMVRGLVVLTCVALTLTACGRTVDKRIRFDDQIFRGNAKAIDRADKRYFVATAGPVSRSLEGAREALRYEGTKYCIKHFGISDIEWDVDPQAEATALPIADDKLVIKGHCVE